MNNPPAEQPGASLRFRLICRVARALVLLLLLLAGRIAVWPLENQNIS